MVLGVFRAFPRLHQPPAPALQMILLLHLILLGPGLGSGETTGGGDWSDRGCPSSPYRTLDGSCNNIRRPLEGAAYTPFTPLVSSPRLPRGDNLMTEGLTRLLEIQSFAKPHGHATALVGLWSELLLRDLSLPLTTEEGLVNGATGYLDGSGLYGQSEEEETSLLNARGSVKIQACSECMKGTGIGGLYTTLFKEHNRIASGLSDLNKNWSPEHVFQEARKILIAEIQHITYSEYLPLILSEKDWAEHLVYRGFYKGYSSNNGGGTYLETALSALQLLPTMVPSSLSSNGFTNETGIFETDHILSNTLMAALSPALEPNLNSRIINALQLIEYSRNQGLAPYVDVIKQCTQKSVKSFSQFENIPEEYIQLLSTVYK